MAYERAQLLRTFIFGNKPRLTKHYSSLLHLSDKPNHTILEWPYEPNPIVDVVFLSSSLKPSTQLLHSHNPSHKNLPFRCMDTGLVFIISCLSSHPTQRLSSPSSLQQCFQWPTLPVPSIHHLCFLRGTRNGSVGANSPFRQGIGRDHWCHWQCW